MPPFIKVSFGSAEQPGISQHERLMAEVCYHFFKNEMYRVSFILESKATTAGTST